jgi:ABC-type glycerol-3-phosphate transport system substrate-binding protein
MWIRGEDHPEGIAFIELLNGFTEATGIEVNYNGVGDDLPTILGTRVEGGDPPDIAVLAQPGLLRDLVTREAAQPVSQAVSDGMAANFAPVWADLATVDGTLYGVYFKAGNKSLVFYDIEAFDGLGAAHPESWDDWLTTSQNFVDNGFTPLAVGGADGWTLSDWFENVYVRTAGADTYAQLTNHEIPWTDQSVVDAFSTMGELIGNPDFVAGGPDGALQAGFVDAIVSVFGAGDAVMIEGPGDIAGIANTETGAVVGTDLAMFPFPSIDGSPGSVLGGGDVAVALTDNPSAMALLEYLTTPEAVESWAAAGGFTSPNQNLDLGIYPDDLSRATAEGLVNAEVFVFDMSDSVPAALGGTAGAGIWGGLQNWLENPDNVEAVLEQIEAEAVAAFGE